MINESLDIGINKVPKSILGFLRNETKKRNQKVYVVVAYFSSDISDFHFTNRNDVLSS